MYILPELIEKAQQKYGLNITPCCDENGQYKTWNDCISEFQGHIYLWFNTVDNSTHIVKEKM